MSSSQVTPEKLDSLRILKLIVRRKKQLLNVGIAALLASITFTFPVFMKPMFKATAVVYPANIQPYSKETPTEQLIQLLNSEDVWLKLADSLDLYKHYGIDTASAYPTYTMMKYLGDFIKVNKTEYESVEINAFDEDPVRAAAMCNALLALTDQKAIALIHTRSTEQSIIMKDLMDQKKVQLDSLEAAIHKVRTTYGISDFEQQVNGFSREYYRSLGTGKVNSRMETDRHNLEDKGGEYVTLREFLWKVRGQYAEYKGKYDEIQSDMRKQLSFHNNITKATPPERKDSPKRTLIIVLFTLSMLFVAVLVMVFQEFYSQRLKVALEEN